MKKVYSIRAASRLIGISQPSLVRHIKVGHVEVSFRQIPVMTLEQINKFKKTKINKFGKRYFEKAGRRKIAD